MIPISTLRWRGISAAAAPVCGFARPSSKPPPAVSREVYAMTVIAKIQDVSGRGVLTGGVASGFLLAFHLPVRATNEPVQPPDVTDGKFAPNAFIRIDHSGKTTLVMPQVEMGQGTYTSISMILAEELDANFAQVAVERGPPRCKLYANPLFGLPITRKSKSLPSFSKPLRHSGS